MATLKLKRVSLLTTKLTKVPDSARGGAEDAE
jgi:hypothetical protein